MKFCPDCGTGHDCTAETGDRVSDAVRIAELETRRDIEVAKVQARMAREELETAEAVAETEADAQVETAIAEAEVLGAAIEAGVVAEESVEPVIIDAPPPADDDGDDAEQLPPAEGSPAPAPATSRRIGLGAW